PAGFPGYVGSAGDVAWRVRSSGDSVKPDHAFGWAMSFTLPSEAGSGAVPVHFVEPVSGTDRAIQVGAIVLWGAAIAYILIDLRRRRGGRAPAEAGRPGRVAPLTVRGRRTERRRTGPAPIGAGDLQGDEVWVDV